MKTMGVFKAFQSGDLSLGELAKILEKDLADTIMLLGQLKIPLADYTLEEEINTIEALGLNRF